MIGIMLYMVKCDAILHLEMYCTKFISGNITQKTKKTKMQGCINLITF